MTGSLWIVGSINMDLVTRAPRFPLPGETILGHGFARFPGGKGANQAIAAARQGARTRMVGAVGDDAFGREMRATLDRAGVETRHIHIRATYPTGIAAITVAGGDNMIVVAEGANAQIDLAAIAGLEIAAGDIVVAQLEIPAEAVRTAFARGRAAGTRTILNLAPAGRDARTLIALSDIVVLNETELAAAAGLSVADPRDDAAIVAGAERLRARDDQVFVVTLGRHGVVAAGPGGRLRLAAHAVEVVDTTGAGDCFVGTLAARLLAGAGLAAALLAANAAAALAVGVAGAGPSMPRHAEVEAFLAARPVAVARIP